MRRRVVVVLAVAALFGIAGCLGGGGEPTPTVTPEPTTTDVPTTTTTPEPTATLTTTTATPTTTIAEPEPNIHATVGRIADQAVYDGEAEFRLRLSNSGPAGEYAYNVTVVRQEGGDFDRTATGTVAVGANAAINRTVTIDFRATGTYTVYLNGQPESIVDVRGLRVSGGGKTSTTTTAEPTTTDKETTTTVSGPHVNVEGDTNAGAE